MSFKCQDIARLEAELPPAARVHFNILIQAREDWATARALVTPELQELIASAREVYFLLCSEYHCDPDEDEIVKRLREATRPFDAIWV